MLVWPGFEPSTSCLAYRRLSNGAAVSSKISGFRYNAMFTFMMFILTFSLCSRFRFISSCCFCSLWIQPSWSGTHQGVRPSSFLLTAFTAPSLISKTIMTESRRPSLTLADPWVAILSSLVVLACLTVTLDEPELESWFVNEVIRPKPRSLSCTFVLLLNSSV